MMKIFSSTLMKNIFFTLWKIFFLQHVKTFLQYSTPWKICFLEDEKYFLHDGIYFHDKMFLMILNLLRHPFGEMGEGDGRTITSLSDSNLPHQACKRIRIGFFSLSESISCNIWKHEIMTNKSMIQLISLLCVRKYYIVYMYLSQNLKNHEIWRISREFI